MRQACLFSLLLFKTVAKSSTECIIFIPFHTNNKSRTPLLSGSFYLFRDDEGTPSQSLSALLSVCFFPRAYTCLHHQVAHAANPWPAGDFP